MEPTVMNFLVRLSKGNPGAAVALAEMVQAPLGPEAIIILDEIGIKGTDIYVLWSDICGKDSLKAVRTIHNANDGIVLTREVLKDACSRQDYSGKEMIFPTTTQQPC